MFVEERFLNFLQCTTSSFPKLTLNCTNDRSSLGEMSGNILDTHSQSQTRILVCSCINDHAIL